MTSQRAPRITHGTLPGLALVILPFLTTAEVAAQEPQRGPRHVDPRWHAIVHATVVPGPGELVEDATIVLRDGVLLSVEAGAAPPAGARVWDASGLTVYAGFVEPHLEVESPSPDAHGAHWNALVVPQRSALDGEDGTHGAGVVGEGDRKALRKLGFTAACVVPDDGVLRGTSALVSLGEPATDTEAAPAGVLATECYQAFAFQTAGWSSGGVSYPSSEMGAIALLRQTFLDAEWHAHAREVYARAPERNEPPQRNDALEALSDATTPLCFEASNELQILRAAALAGELGRTLLIRGSGTEFRRLDAIAGLGAPVLLPLDFPDEPEVGTLAEADRVSLRALMTWEQAPTNARRLVEAGVQVALTTDELDDKGDFAKNLRKAILHGLGEDDALAMLTTNPAEVLGVADRLGRVAPGFLANLVVTDGPLFDEETEIRDVWVGGRRHEINAAPDPDYDGDWSGTIARLGANEDVDATFSVDDGDLVVKALDQEEKTREFTREEERITFLLDGSAFGEEGTWSFSGRVEGSALFGTLLDPDGGLASVEVERVDSAGDEEEDDSGEEEENDDDPPSVPETFGMPFGAYGLAELPAQEALLLTNATVWTSGPDGILEDAAVLIRDGKIEYVGPATDAPSGATVLDLEGKHLTPGLIDCHSHTGISRGVNEMGQRVTAEVRVADVIDPDSINWYRQLAGGLTAANQLHGSGNAVGAQNSVVKLRWGAALPEAMRLDGAIAGIKFALGENPKRVAQNTKIPDEYPQTRMGVATLIRDRLLAGREYRAAHERYARLSRAEKALTVPPRRDLELEALGEITAGERLVHCHSYRQDEILMLCEIAGEMGFRIGTFQHVLEGYKVAEAIKEAAIGGSTFSDWWAYKFEVVDAIPHNAAIMHEVGVVVSINSDSADHARRLNTEAAKSMKYGGLDPAEALALVTINPAIQLMVDDRIGSLEVGKDADLAVWSGDPLSYRSRCERTFVDGRELYSIERDRELGDAAQRERQRIVQKILADDAPDVVADANADPDEEDDEAEEEPGRWVLEEARLRAGIAPGEHLPGECGCDAYWMEEVR